MERLKAFLQESRQEFRRINWPALQETIRLTIVVIVLSLGVAIFLGAIDYGFFFFLNKFILFQ